MNWPQPSIFTLNPTIYPYMEVGATMDLITSCSRLNRLEIFTLFEEMPKAKRKQIRKLSIKEIIFESIGARGLAGFAPQVSQQSS